MNNEKNILRVLYGISDIPRMKKLNNLVILALNSYLYMMAAEI